MAKQGSNDFHIRNPLSDPSYRILLTLVKGCSYWWGSTTHGLRAVVQAEE